MKTLILNPKEQFLLGAGLDVLHFESREWLNNLDKIHVDLFEDLEDSIREHEQLLSRIERKEKGLSDYDYREKHKRIKNRIAVFESDFKSFKKIVFDYVKPL